MSDYNLLLSWSHTLSRTIATELKDWIPTVVPGVAPWISTKHLAKGKMWFPGLMDKLQTIKFGIVCLTNDNIYSPYLYYEAGAIASKLTETAVYPLLFGLTKETESALKDTPFGELNWTHFSEEDFRTLLTSISQHMGFQYSETHLDDSYKVKWPILQMKIDKLVHEAKSRVIEIPIVEAEQPLSNESSLILCEASQAPDGIIIICEHFEGTSFSTNGKNICLEQDAATIARFKQAIKKLVKAGFIEETGKDCFQLTAEGHERASKLYTGMLGSLVQQGTKLNLNDDDIISILETWLGKHSDVEAVMYPDQVDSENNLPPGSCARLLEIAAKKWNLILDRKGQSTIKFKKVSQRSSAPGISNPLLRRRGS